MRLTEKSQVTIPKPIREKLGIGPGSEVEFVEVEDRVVLMKLDDAARKRREVEGWLRAVRGTGSGAMSADEVMEATRGPFDDLDPR